MFEKLLNTQKDLSTRLLEWGHHKNAPWVLRGVAYCESVFLPMPPDVLLVPMSLADRAQAWRFARICTLWSVLGGLTGYTLGYFFMNAIELYILTPYGFASALEAFRAQYASYGFVAIFLGALTPVPYKVVVIAAGGFHVPVGLFVVASLLGRGLRFHALAVLCFWVGPQRWVREYFFSFCMAVGSVVVIGVLVYQFWH